MNYTRPSALPIQDLSPCYQPGDTTEFAEAGTQRHEALAKLVATKDASLVEALDDEDQEQVRWAAEYIDLHAQTRDYPLKIEAKLTFTGPEFEDITGTVDYECGPCLFDLKSRYRDYSAQMAAYALGKFEAEPDLQLVTTHLLFGVIKRPVVMQWDRAAAEATVFPIIQSVYAWHRTEEQGRGYTPSEYCGWCARRLTCPHMTKLVDSVVAGRDDWALETYHSSQLEKPVEMGKALRIARLMQKWCDAVEYHAEQMAVKRGVTIPGFVVKPVKGKRSVADLNLACAHLGIDPKTFLSLCNISIGELEKHYKTMTGLSLERAKQEMERKLGEVLQRAPSSHRLTATKE